VPGDNARGQRALEVIEESLDRLEQLVSSARRLDQASAEVLDAPRQRIDLSQLLDRMLAAYATTLSERGLRLDAKVTPGIAVRAGDELMETVIENIVDNAIGIAPPDTAIGVELKRDGAWAVLSVRDRGPGVASDDLERIFDRYVSLRGAAGADAAHRAAASEGAHMGIGLWIVRRNIEAVGGRVTAENRPGGGLAVVVHLPRAA
jgi:two-component system sensor histidine kinase ChvG